MNEVRKMIGSLPHEWKDNIKMDSFIYPTDAQLSGFGDLVVSVLASSTQDRGFKSGRSHPIFQAKKSAARLPSEGE